MNKLFYSLIIIIINFLICFVSFKNTSTIAKKSLDYLEKIEKLIYNNQDTEQKTQEFNEFWNKKSKILQILVHHEQVENINLEIAKLESASKLKNKFEILKTCNCLKSKLENLEKIDEFSLENIL